MANFGVMKITSLGMDLYTKIQTGSLIQFTKIQSGDGVLPGGTNIEDLTVLISPKFDVSIESFQVDTENHIVRIKGTKTNDGLLEGNFSREIGLFAIDPDIGEILYAYANAGEYPDYIPPISTGPYSKTFVINAAIGNATNVTAVIPIDIYVTQETFNIYKDEVTEDIYTLEQSMDSALFNKVDKIAGKGLSTNDYTSTEKAKVANLPSDTNTALEGKAPTSHASSATTYGVGTTANYGHVKTINDLTKSSHVSGEALSAYQGYLLNQNKIATSQKGAVNGVATLGADSKIPYTQIPDSVEYGESSFSVSIAGAVWPTAYYVKKTIPIGANVKELELTFVDTSNNRQDYNTLTLYAGVNYADTMLNNTQYKHIHPTNLGYASSGTVVYDTISNFVIAEASNSVKVIDAYISGSNLYLVIYNSQGSAVNYNEKVIFIKKMI